MKYCSKCGKELADEAAFCNACGNPTDLVVAPAKTTIAEEDVILGAEKEIGSGKIFPLIALGLAVAGVILYLFVHTIVGIVAICGAGACTFVMSIKLNRHLKALGIEKNDKKKIEIKLRKENKFLKLNFIATMVVGVCLILGGIGFGVLDSIKAEVPYKYHSMADDSYGKGFVTQFELWDDICDYSKAVDNFSNWY